MTARRATIHVLTLLTVLSFATGRSLGAEPSSDWQSRAFAEIAAREYELSLEGDWQAPNRAQGLRSHFTETGLRVLPRVEGEHAWEWGLTLHSYGRPGALPSTLSTPRLSPFGNRVNRDWGGIVEWYVNDARGLEHGFTIAQSPTDSSAATSDVHVDLTLTGTLDPSFSADGQAIDFRMPGGPYVLRYGGLAVVDAVGRALPARMEGFAKAGVRGVRIVYDDRDAVYPVTIDPIATSAAWSAEGNQTNGQFGFSVATAGDVNGDGYSDVIVGATQFDGVHAQEGRAFVFLGSASGLAATPAWNVASGQTAASFGCSVAPAGDVNGDGFGDVIVGARSYDNGQTDEGRAFVYLGSATGLAATAAWTAESDQAGASFGASVATAGDVNGDGYADAIVGAVTYDNGQTDEGRVFVYLGSPSGLSLTAAWSAESNQASALFGVSVSTAGDVNGDGFGDVVVGARQYDNGQADEGRAFVYLGSATGLAAVAAWTAESDQGAANFGRSVSTAGDVNGDGYSDVIVGAYTYDNGQADEGRAYVYLGSAVGLSGIPAWTVESDQANAQFGITVATAGDVNGDGYADVIVGSYLYDNGQADEGRAFIYYGSATGLATTPAWTGETNEASAQFGWSVATAGDVNGDGFSDVIVGANLSDNGQADEGRTYLYFGAASGLTSNENWAVDSNQSLGRIGWSVASAGDVNGDGYDDVVAGATGYYNGLGAALVYLGSPTGPGVIPDAILDENLGLPGGGGVANFGRSVAAAGDVNGDGYGDVIVGGFGGFNSVGGKAYVFLGSASGVADTPVWTATPSQIQTDFAFSVAGAGDINGDGYADVIVGEQKLDVLGAGPDAGAAYVYYGSPSGPSPTPSWSRTGPSQSDQFGSSVASAGDVNRDGYSDVIIGASHPGNIGKAYVFLGSPFGLAFSPLWTASGSVGAEFGESVACAGDINGDGYSDVVVGAPKDSVVSSLRGRLFVYLGSPTGPSATFDTAIDGGATSDQFAFSVAGVGDVNGDGLDDVVTGNQPATGLGNKAYLYLGSASGLATAPAWTRLSPQDFSFYAKSVSGAGDVNGDGFADVLIGAPDFRNPDNAEGLVMLHYGNGVRGRDRSVLQVRADGTAPIGPMGRSDSQTSFRVRAKGSSALGRARVRLQWEAKPYPASFVNADVEEGAASDTGAPAPGSAGGVEFNQLVSELTPGTLHHWRARVATDSPYFPFTRWMTPSFAPARWLADLRTPLCQDLDGDGYGLPADLSCPRGLVPDCDDYHSTAYPGGTEVCDGIDNDCNGTLDDAAVPAGSPSLLASRSGGNTLLTWSLLPGANIYSVVRGGLGMLRSTGGNFTTALTECVADNTFSTSVTSAATPLVDDGFFFLVRGDFGVCARGTYNAASPSQAGSRDAEIAASPAACP
jgi:hypothetical protein